MSPSSGMMGGVNKSQAAPAKIPFQPPVAPVSKSMGQAPKKKVEDNLDDLMMM